MIFGLRELTSRRRGENQSAHRSYKGYFNALAIEGQLVPLRRHNDQTRVSGRATAVSGVSQCAPARATLSDPFQI